MAGALFLKRCRRPESGDFDHNPRIGGAPFRAPHALRNDTRRLGARIDAPLVTNDAPTMLRVTARELERVNVRCYASS
jgi:hypothetical protein